MSTVLNSNARLLQRIRVGGLSQPVSVWALIGLALFLFEGYVWLSWILGSNFKPTDPGSDPISQVKLNYFLAIQIALPMVAVVMGWYFIIKPWIKTGRMTTDGMLAISALTLVFYDCSMNYTSATVLYNAHMFNMGSWTAGSWPGWTSPKGNLLPEPLLFIVPGYLVLGFSQSVIACWLLRKAKTRWPGLGVPSMIGLIFVGAFIADTVIEVIALRPGFYAYPGGIRELTLFAGETYQFPLTEAFFIGGLAFGAIAVLRFFKNDRDETFVEKGLDQLALGAVARQQVKFLAIFGYCHLTFILLFTIPNQWLATHSDPFPEAYPSYMLNGLCAYGPEQNQCPGPGVMMPRPIKNPL